MGCLRRLLPGVKLDILITNAGNFSGLHPLGTKMPAELNTAFSVNMLGLYLAISAFLPLAAPGSTIINISSPMAHLPSFPSFSSYGATKLAGYKLLDYVAASNPELRVVNVHPGQVAETETEMAGKGAKCPDLDAHIDDVELAGDFTVWVASGEARFLKGKFV
jgi:NADP-dependent 3-hydroxy acid dehydrogenase YdfG